MNWRHDCAIQEWPTEELLRRAKRITISRVRASALRRFSEFIGPGQTAAEALAHHKRRKQLDGRERRLADFDREIWAEVHERRTPISP